MDPEITENPLLLLEAWMAEAARAGQPLPEAMTLATVSAEGRPSARVVLYKGLSKGGLTFFTNYESRKAQELEATPYAAAVFHWPSLQRQLRVEGPIEKLSGEESDAYFATRPRDSQLGAWASPQSRVVASRQELESMLEDVARRFPDGPVPRPPHWGGYRLIPERIEAWLGRPGRLHDRFLYAAGPEGWKRVRLAP